MKKTLFTAALFTVVFAVGSFAANTTRYWDACKPSCAWTGNAGGSPNGAATACDINGSKLSDANARNACESGPAYTCMGQAPWSVDANTSYGFAASHTNSDCGKCFELTFTNTGVSGKKMIVMVSNIGGDVGQQQFDLMIPGGGVGQFNALSNQLSQKGGGTNLGQTYGGFRATCGNNATCVRDMCNAAFSTAALADLKAGCHWYVDWFQIADNPNANVQSVTCPQALVTAYKDGKGGGSGGPPPATTYTLTMSVNPNNSGTTNPASSQANISAGTPVNISATPANGYTFTNWTVTSGTATFGNANSQNTTVTLNANATIRANFTQQQGGTTYTLTVNREPTAGGTTNPSSSQANIQSGTPVSISANPNSGYTFTNWTVVTGTATIANPNSQNTTVTLTANATIRANFTQVQGSTTYTLTVTRNPSGGGSTTPTASQSGITAGAPVTISATPNNGYYFVNWTVTSGTATFDDANNQSTTVALTANATIRANFQQGNPPGGGNRTDTTKIEAEDYTSKSGDGMRTETENGITCIGYIENGYSTTYNNVNVSKSGSYAMEFRIALNQADVSSSTFTVTVNGSQVGAVTSTGTGGWNTYQIVRLNSDVRLNQGNNTIVLNFGNAINVDYILLLGEGGTPVRFNSAQAKPVRTRVTLTASPRGFTAALPTSHGYTTYRLIDLQGREVKSGSIGNGTSSLKFNNLKNSVLFLRLEGKNTSTVVKAVTY